MGEPVVQRSDGQPWIKEWAGSQSIPDVGEPWPWECRRCHSHHVVESIPFRDDEGDFEMTGWFCGEAVVLTLRLLGDPIPYIPSHDNLRTSTK